MTTYTVTIDGCAHPRLSEGEARALMADWCQRGRLGEERVASIARDLDPAMLAWYDVDRFPQVTALGGV